MTFIDLDTSEDEVERAVLAALSDEDEDIDVGEALAVLVYVTFGICCSATSQLPEVLAAEFTEALGNLIAEHNADAPRLLS